MQPGHPTPSPPSRLETWRSKRTPGETAPRRPTTLARHERRDGPTSEPTPDGHTPAPQALPPARKSGAPRGERPRKANPSNCRLAHLSPDHHNLPQGQKMTPLLGPPPRRAKPRAQRGARTQASGRRPPATRQGALPGRSPPAGRASAPGLENANGGNPQHRRPLPHRPESHASPMQSNQRREAPREAPGAPASVGALDRTAGSQAPRRERGGGGAATCNREAETRASRGRMLENKQKNRRSDRDKCAAPRWRWSLTLREQATARGRPSGEERERERRGGCRGGSAAEGWAPTGASPVPPLLAPPPRPSPLHRPPAGARAWRYPPARCRPWTRERWPSVRARQTSAVGLVVARSLVVEFSGSSARLSALSGHLGRHGEPRDYGGEHVCRQGGHPRVAQPRHVPSARTHRGRAYLCRAERDP